MFTVGPTSDWIMAVGLPNNQWTGKHTIYGSFTGLNLYDSCVAKQQQPAEEDQQPAEDTTTGTTGNNTSITGTTGNNISNGANTGNGGVQDDTQEETTQDSQANADNSSTSTSSTSSAAQASSSTTGLEFGQAYDPAETRGLWVSHGIVSLSTIKCLWFAK
jgi:hypothetical protein